jgi:two-component system response regulator MprA
VPVPKSKNRVLIADDERLILRLLHNLLSKKGYATYLADNGESVLEECQKGGYSFLILDLELGQDNGLKIIEDLRARGDRIPVILISGKFAPGAVPGLILPEGVVGLAKPFELDELDQAIKRVLGKEGT